CTGNGTNGGAALPQTDARVTGSFAGTAEDDLIAVFEEGSYFSRGQTESTGSVACQFEQTSRRLFLAAGDRSSRQNIAGLEVTSVAGVVSDHLSRSPVKVSGVAPAKQKWGKIIILHHRRSQKYFKHYINISILLIGSKMKIREWLR